MVPVDEIRSNDYDLTLNKYKKVIRDEVHYRGSNEILGELKTIAKDICDNIEKISEMLGE